MKKRRKPTTERPEKQLIIPPGTSRLVARVARGLGADEIVDLGPGARGSKGHHAALEFYRRRQAALRARYRRSLAARKSLSR